MNDLGNYNCTKMKFSIKDFFCKREFFFCVVYIVYSFNINGK